MTTFRYDVEEIPLIKSFADKRLEKCWRTGRCSDIKNDLARRLNRKLDILDSATSLDDVARVPSCRELHRLKGPRKHEIALPVNGPWRLVFEYKEGDFYNVGLEQYH